MAVAILLLASGGKASAEPADPTLFLLIQPDGTSFMARQWGDERSHGFETASGHTIIRDAGSGRWAYAGIGPDGRLKNTGLAVARGAAPLSARNLRPRARGPAKITTREFRNPRRGGVSAASSEGPQRAVPASGSANVPVLLVDFSDRVHTYTNEQIEDVIFKSGNSSSKDYFEEISYGAFTISSGPGGVAGWYTAANVHDYYGRNDAGGDDMHPAELVIEAVTAADPSFDFAPYDQDGDCYVDIVSIIYQGTPENISPYTPEDIWPHRWNLFSAAWYGDGSGVYETDDDCLTGPGPVYVNDYTVQAEIKYGGIMTIGTFTHEYGHALGLPDLYDTDYSSNGVGRWSLMASGGHNSVSRSGDSPAHLDPWSKYRLGWITPAPVWSTLTNESIDQAAAAADVYQFLAGTPASGEYFLLENRQRAGFDSGLPGEGLLIWHIAAAVSSNRYECYPGSSPSCSAQHYKVALEQADNLYELEKPAYDRGDTGDPFPGSTGNTSFFWDTGPSSSLYSGALSAVKVTDISSSGPVMTATLSIPNLLVVSVEGGGAGVVTSIPVGIECGVDCSEEYADATPVMLTPNPAAGSFFAGWTGDDDCVDGSVTMNASMSCTATFSLPRHTLAVVKAGTGTGTVKSAAGIDCGADCTGEYDHGTAVTLNAEAGGRSLFTGWSGDPDCADGSVLMNADVGCTATFNALGDWSGDGLPDMLWRDPSTGRNAVLFLAGPERIGLAFLPDAPVDWNMTAAADFNGDGNMDMLWRNSRSGACVISYFEGTAFKGIRGLKLQPLPWEVSGTGDMDADGFPDILWRDPSTGRNEVWYMNDFRQTGTDSLPEAPLPWQIIGADDIDNDGLVDLLARNPLTGQNAVGFMNAGALNRILLLPAADPAWEFCGSMDLDRDGNVDLLWCDPSAGKNEVWYMDGVGRRKIEDLPSAPPPWRGMGGYR